MKLIRINKKDAVKINLSERVLNSSRNKLVEKLNETKRFLDIALRNIENQDTNQIFSKDREEVQEQLTRTRSSIKKAIKYLM